MKKLLTVLFCVSLLFSCYNERGYITQKLADNSLHNKEYRELTKEINIFSGFDDFGGTVIDDRDDNRRALGHIKKDSLHIILLEKINKGSKPTRQILDTIHFISNSENHYTDFIECEDIKDSNKKLLFGFHFYEEEKEYFDKIVFAWRVNLKDNRLEIIEPKGIKCYNIGYEL